MSMLSVFSKFKNPKALYRQEDLHNLCMKVSLCMLVGKGRGREIGEKYYRYVGREGEEREREDAREVKGSVL